MAREPIVTESPLGEDPERDLRPQRIADMVGQREVMQRLDIVLDAARKRGEPLGHILFDGPPGLGKTTFATCIPREMNVPLVTSSGPALKAPKDLIPYLTNLEEGAVLFIDEIHRMPKPVEEYLYTAMEDFRLDIVLGEGVNARTINLKLKQFTLIGATTRAGMLSGPLRDRFHIREHLGFYTVEELVEIIRRNSRKLQIPLTDEAAVEIARRSRGTPRVANNRLRWVRDYADSKAGGSATLEVARAALLMAGVDVLGLDKQDRGYLETIIRVFGGGPVGVDAVAHTMNLATDTLSDEVEPFLLRSELVVRTPRGRVVTTKAYQHLQIKPIEKPKETDQRMFE
ncbi:Holliday junction ATP-dependent DNA helicase RuvB [Anatilimnocola aggregata]|uniref:Holliday junction branch migration complex subunit RuvB n=1 Tax=Anatilimnocola aggregata TaxID=2528021 RepID=A0A517YHB8_9BACT|nr:Holliday junction branch migration DNA helicase RuvB [Anatilimnocola aggregata]QDU29613.1 Holliday junction ATP-dependent DNA helicase RuvB [Anatilimnocola aggregata]